MKSGLEQCTISSRMAEVAKSGGRVVRDLPYYKPSLATAPDFFSVGIDIAIPLFDPLLVSNSTTCETISYLYGGIGDARHLFRTLRMIWELEIKGLNKGRRLPPVFEGFKRWKYYFTVNDISSRTIARDLVFVLLLEEIADAVSDTAPEHVTIAPKALVTLFFAFVGYVMPQNSFQHLQEKIQDAIDLLEENRSAPSFLHLYDYGREPILRALVSWRKQVADAYPVGSFVAQAEGYFTTMERG
jgi:hypothetical protein